MQALPTELVAVADLRPHPRNYRVHPQDEIDHLKESIKEHGVYRNVVVARDLTILAGHGVVQALKELGSTQVPVVRLPLAPDEPRAIKLLVADNEIAHLVENDDRVLAELLREVKDNDLEGLLGTGYDEMMLATLAMVTRPRSELADFDAAAEWVGMPEYVDQGPDLRIVVHFANKDDRAEFLKRLEVDPNTVKLDAVRIPYLWFPPRARNDRTSVKFVADGA